MKLADFAALLVVCAAVVAMFGGLSLAVYMNDARWLLLSVVAFIFLYAG